MKLQRDVYIAGVAETAFRSHQKDFDELGRDVALEAMLASNIDNPKFIQSAYVGNGTNGICTGQAVLKGLGMCGYLPIINVESACSSGAMAVHCAVKDVSYGVTDISLAIGTENHTLHRKKGFAFAVAPSDIEGRHGAVMTGKYALRAKRWMHETGGTAADLAMVTVKNRRHGKNNPFALYRDEISVEEVLNSKPVASPLTLQQCCAIADGAAAVIVCSKAMIDKLGIEKPVKIAGSTVRSGVYHNHPRDITDDDIVGETADELYEESAIGPKEVDILELHDAFTIAEVIYYEVLKLCEKGGSLDFLRSGQSTYGGQCVVNPRGGMLSYGHPVGASGAAQIAACVKQMRGLCGGYQVNPVPRIGMTQVTGGGLSGTEHAACTMHMLVSGW